MHWKLIAAHLFDVVEKPGSLISGTRHRRLDLMAALESIDGRD
jgi:hypothetical protein